MISNIPRRKEETFRRRDANSGILKFFIRFKITAEK